MNHDQRSGVAAIAIGAVLTVVTAAGFSFNPVLIVTMLAFVALASWTLVATHFSPRTLVGVWLAAILVNFVLLNSEDVVGPSILSRLGFAVLFGSFAAALWLVPTLLFRASTSGKTTP